MLARPIVARTGRPPSVYTDTGGEAKIARRLHETTAPRERAFLVATEVTRRYGRWDTQASLGELALLADTAGAKVVGSAVQRLERPNSATYIGRGKVQEIVSQRSSLGYSTVIFDDELSPSQQRRLEKELEVKVLDRTALILDIFAQHAHTREGRLQVELAQHEYILPRLRGQWSHLERLEGRIGTRGPGETQLETDRRLIRNRIQALKQQIEQVRRQRALHRRQRARQGMPVVSLVGYTNSGKSTLMRTFSGADVLVEDRLFATLDPVTRRVRLPSGNMVLLTDTVGFIQKLPTKLVAAFRATLEELEEASLLLHVVDVTHPNAVQQAKTVEATLAALNLARKPLLAVLNKADIIIGGNGASLEEALAAEAAQALLEPWGAEALVISAAKGWGMEEMGRRLETSLAEASSSDV